MARALDDICDSAAGWDKAKDNLAIAVAGYKIVVKNLTRRCKSKKILIGIFNV